MTLAAQCGEWASSVFEEVFADVQVQPLSSDGRFGKGYQHLAIAVIREHADEQAVKNVTRHLAQVAKRNGLRRFIQLELPQGIESASRFIQPNGLSFRACEVYSPPQVSEGGHAVPEMWVIRFDVAGMPV